MVITRLITRIRSLSITKSVVLWVVALVAASSGVVAVSMLMWYFDVNEIHDERQLELQKDLWTRVGEDWQAGARRAVTDALGEPGVVASVKKADKDALVDALATMYNYTADALSLADWVVVGIDGVPIASLENPLAPLDGEWLAGGVSITRHNRTESVSWPDNGPGFLASIYDRGGKQVGWMHLRADRQSLVRRLRELVGHPVGLLLPDGNFITSSQEDSDLFSAASSYDTDEFDLVIGKDCYSVYCSQTRDTERLIMAYDVTEELRNTRAMIVKTTVFGFLLIMALVVVGLSALRRRLRPLKHLAAVMRDAIATGDLSEHVQVSGRDEITDLSDAFNTLSDRVTQQIDQIAQERELAEAASIAKSTFLANMSHEIRTPMTAILGFTDVLLHEEISETEARETVSIVNRNGRHLLALINDILDLSKIEAQQMTLEQIDCSLVQILRDVDEFIAGQAAEKEIGFEIDIDPELPAYIVTDPTRLRQVLLNLAGNAIKFTERGSVRLSACPSTARDDGRLGIEITVEDSGIGMNTKQVEKIFKPFIQADGSMTRRYGGTGLGLAISRSIAQMMGGDIQVESQFGQGSRFTMTLVCDRSNKSNTSSTQGIGRVAVCRSSTPDHALDGIRFLVAEDGPDNQRLIRFYLEKSGASVEVVGNGQLACDAALDAMRRGKPFDIILMDMQMPVLDGYSATSKLRGAGYSSTIIALTAHAMADDRDRCIGAGCDVYLTKPIDREQLVDECLAALRRDDADTDQRAAG